MSKSFKILQPNRKLIALLLLVNFLFTTFLYSIPYKECDGSCNVVSEVLSCCEKEKMTCCDMMDMNSENNNNCEMEITDNSCDYVIHDTNEVIFLLPKTINTQIQLILIDSINLSFENEVKTPIVHSFDVISNSSPPIYINISSFLI